VQADKLTGEIRRRLLSCKAFDLDDAIQSFAPAVGPADHDHPAAQRHAAISACWTTNSAASGVGGLCAIAATLNAQREVVQLNPMQSLNFRRTRRKTIRRVRAISGFSPAALPARRQRESVQEMWEKWVFLATLAAAPA